MDEPGSAVLLRKGSYAPCWLDGAFLSLSRRGTGKDKRAVTVATGVPVSVIAAAEGGKPVGRDVAERLAEFYDCTVLDLVRGHLPRSPSQTVATEAGTRHKWFEDNRSIDPGQLDALLAEARVRLWPVRHISEQALRNEWRLSGLSEARARVREKLAVRGDLSNVQLKALAEAYYYNGLRELTRYLKAPSKLVAPVDAHSLEDPSIVLIKAGSPLSTQTHRNIALSRAKRLQREALYELTGYISAHTRYFANGAPSTLARAINSVLSHSEEGFRKRLKLELPGTLYLARFGDEFGNTRPLDKEHRATEEESNDLDRAAKAYNERLRKLGYKRWHSVRRGWETIPEGRPLPKPLDSEIKRLARNARDWVEYDTRGVRRDYTAVVKVRDEAGFRQLTPDTRSDGTDPENGYQDTRGWQEHDRRHRPDPAEYEIEAAMMEGDVLVPDAFYADPERGSDREENQDSEARLHDEAMSDEEMLLLEDTEPEEEPGVLEDDLLTLDFNHHHALCIHVDDTGDKHLKPLDFDQSLATKGARKFALRYDPEKYAAAYEKGALCDCERKRLYPSYRVAALLDLLGKHKLPRIGGGGGTFVRYEDEETGRHRTIKADRFSDLIHELDDHGPSRFGLTDRQRDVFGCYWGTSDMTLSEIAKRLNVSEVTIKRGMRKIRTRMSENGILLPAQAERRGR